ncbi:hypothetical protein VKT23_000815 [Stygiomarasmius scandens]|uniref:Expansin-like EG45 domain-containing protein n=1 Tax=Marasmiellus scandens TaxID=2682957 RepID=A0ABR1K5F3_9AGAR
MMAPSAISLFVLALGLVSFALASSWIQYPPDGLATMTHYDLPKDYIAACACNGPSTHYPTAALSQMAFGSSTAYGWSPRSANNCNDLTMHKPGPACGRCFNLTLLNTFLSVPPFFPPTPKSVVVKVTDLCPLSTTGWCNATQEGPNMAGHYLNFDLAYPSDAIPDDFFPSDASYYGYTVSIVDLSS